MKAIHAILRDSGLWADSAAAVLHEETHQEVVEGRDDEEASECDLRRHSISVSSKAY